MLGAVPPLLNANAVIMCSHGGMFKIAPTHAPTVMVGGAPVLTVADVAPGSMPGGAPCPFATPAGPAPCIKLGSATGGMATKVLVKGVPALMATTTFITIPAGAGVPVPATVMSPGNMTVQGS
jgi:hypothetical protein